MKGKGWRGESRRHSLASKGIKTANKLPKDTWRIMNKLSDQGKEVNVENIRAESMKESLFLEKQFKDLRLIAKEETTSDLQGTVMVRTGRVLKHFNIEDNIYNRNFVDEVLLRYSYGRFSKKDAIQELKSFKKSGGNTWN